MRIVTKVLSIIDMVLLFSVLVCGLWIGSHNVDASSVQFHSTLGIATVIVSFALCIFTLIALKRKKKKLE